MKQNLQRIKFVLLAVFACSFLFLASCEERDDILFDISKNTDLHAIEFTLDNNSAGLTANSNIILDIDQIFSKFKSDGFSFSSPQVNLIQYEISGIETGELNSSESFAISFTARDQNGNFLTTFDVNHDDNGRQEIAFDYSTINTLLAAGSTTINLDILVSDATLQPNVDFNLTFYTDITVRATLKP